MMENVHCNLCGQDSATDWVVTRDRGFGPFAVVRCRRCGLCYVNPRPDEKAIAAYYPHDYYAYAEATPGSLLQRLKALFSQVIAREYHGYVTLDPPHSHAWGIHLLLRVMAHPFRYSLLRLPPYPGKAGARILDVGCATGKDLDLARTCGWETYGVDISPEAATAARRKGHQVFAGRLNEAAYPSAFFDAVMMWDVMEHLHDPRGVLEEISRILVPGGYLLGKALNAASAQARIFRGQWWPGMDVPRHLYFYTPVTLRAYLGQTGFDLIRIVFHSSPRCMSECLDLVWCDAAGRPPWQLHPLVRWIDHIIGAPWAFVFDALGAGDMMVFHALNRRGFRS